MEAAVSSVQTQHFSAFFFFFLNKHFPVIPWLVLQPAEAVAVSLLSVVVQCSPDDPLIRININ